MNILNRALLLITGLLAAYQIVVGIDHMEAGPIFAYTVGFGVLLVAGLLLIILGFEVLESPIVVIVATLIPLALSTGLICQYLPEWRNAYMAFAVLGFSAVILTRSFPMHGSLHERLPVLVLVIVHGLAGIVITFLPLFLVIQSKVPAGFMLVGVGGALIGLGGLLLAFLKTGRPILSKHTILNVLPGLLVLMTAAFVGGFAFA